MTFGQDQTTMNGMLESCYNCCRKQEEWNYFTKYGREFTHCDEK